MSVAARSDREVLTAVQAELESIYNEADEALDGEDPGRHFALEQAVAGLDEVIRMISQHIKETQ